MTSVPAGQRLWKCPDCGTEILLPVTKLDPMACDACMEKLKGGRASKTNTATTTGLSLMPAMPELIRLTVVGVVMLVIGLGVGIVTGRVTAPAPPFVRPERPTEDGAGSANRANPAAQSQDEGPDESTRPGPGYKWVRGYTRKDGVKVKGHWSRDPNYVDPEAPSTKRKK